MKLINVALLCACLMQFANAALDCERCEEVQGVVGTLNCYYDAQVLGCDDSRVQSSIFDDGAFHSNTVAATNTADLLCVDVADAIGMVSRSSSRSSSKGSKGSSRVDACTEVGGTCVVYCDVTAADHECVTGLCDVSIDYEEPVPVLVFDRFFTGCACKVPVSP